MRNWVQALALTWGYLGLLILYMDASFDHSPVSIGNRAFYIWDKGLVVLIAICVLIRPVNRFAWYVFISFLALRLGYEFVGEDDYIKGIDRQVKFSFFLLDILCVIITMVQMLWPKKR